VVEMRDAWYYVVQAYLLFYRVRPRLGRIEVISVLHGRRAGLPRP
jgi:plasmid stabilization system protein ParE